MNATRARGAAAILAAVALAMVLAGIVVEVGQAGPEQTAGDAVYRAIFFYDEDEATANGYKSWLEDNAFQVDIYYLGDAPPPEHEVYLPLVARDYSGGMLADSGEGKESTAPAGPDNGLPNLLLYDLILIGPDSGSGGSWGGSNDLVAAIKASEKQVLALGGGGYAFLGELGLAIGHPYGEAVTVRRGEQADPGQTWPIWDGARPVARPGGVAELYTGNVETWAVHLPEPLPNGMRIAVLPGEDVRHPIAAQGERFTLWGYGGPASALTETGRNLFLNLLDQSSQDLEMPLKAQPFTPPPGPEPDLVQALEGASEPLRGLVQLQQPVNVETRAALAAKGVTLGDYLGGLNYLGSIAPGTDLDDPALWTLVRWLGLYHPEQRIHPNVAAGQVGAHNRLPRGQVRLTVMFFSEVSEGEALNLFEAYGAELEAALALNAWVVVLDEGLVSAVASEPVVQWIEPGPGPLRETNDGGRTVMGTDPVVNFDTTTGQARGLDGSGVRVAVMENRVDTGHGDFGTRFVYTQTAGMTDHATHVAGIIGSSGAQSAAGGGTAFQWRGHAPGVGLMSIPHGSAQTSRYHLAVNTHGAHISNHSYVLSDVVYDATAAGLESIIRGDASHSGNTIPSHLVVSTAGNEGWDNQWQNEEGFFAITAPAKNVLTLGSIDSNDNRLTRFSSRGPTFDNRLKPDVVAPGCQRGGDNGITSTVANHFTNNSPGLNCDGTGDDYCFPYDVMCGTSMSAPATAGALALGLDAYFDLYSTTTAPQPSTIKGLAIHTATDLQHDFQAAGQFWNCPDLCQQDQTATTPISPTCAVQYGAGPDWSTGYGQVNTASLVEQVQHKGFVEDSVSPSDTTDTYTVRVLANRTEIKFTLVWDDEPGSTSTAETTSKLVNDLDLTLTDPNGVVYNPWILDPLTPNATPGSGGFDNIIRANLTAARRGVDRRNNVEQVSVAMPGGLPTGNWTVTVTANSLPNSKTQTYTLLGDYRQLNIVGAQSLTSTGFPVNAGPSANPDEVLVRVKIENPHVTPGYTVNYEPADFRVELGDPGGGVAWQTATVLSVFQTGGEVAIDMQPPAGMAAGTQYDLRVTLIGIDDDTRANAGQFVATDDVAGYWLTDSSGSMLGGKIEAAQEAGKALVDLLQNDDWVGVGHFETTKHHLMNVTKVTGGGQLTTARGHIDSITVNLFQSTAMGPGMDMARQRLNAASLPANTQKIVFLLSDGMENTTEPEATNPPTIGCWDNHPNWDCKDSPPYVKTSWPSDIQAYVVCLGEAGAAWHSFCDQVASDTSGPPVWHVYETPKGATTTSAARLSAADPEVWSLMADFPETPLGSAFDYPTTLPVRLDDAYLDMAQMAHRWPRMLEWTGWISPELEYVEVPFDAEENLPAMHITLEWDDPSAAVMGRLIRPDGSQVNPGDGDVLYYREDRTHIHWGVREPRAATWKVEMMALKSRAETLVTVSGPSDIQMRLLIDPDDTFVYDEIEACALLADNKPIPVSSPAVVAANVIDPAGVAHWLWLHDAGWHEDGAAEDGIFCDRYRGVQQAGVYQIKVIAAGTANDGRQFVRRAMGYAYRRPKVLFLYREEEIGEQYAELLEKEGIKVDLLHVERLTREFGDLAKYALVIIGPFTGKDADWGTDEATEVLAQFRRPTLGLGEGGYAFFGRLKLFIGYPNGRLGGDTDVLAVDLGHSIWQLPHDLKLGQPDVSLYQRTDHVAIAAEDPPGYVELLGREINSRDYYPIIREAAYRLGDGAWSHGLWGYAQGPADMTDQGQRLFVNVAEYMMR